MTKKELAKINKELQNTQKFLKTVDSYQKQLSAMRNLLEVSGRLAKVALPYDTYTQHYETLMTIDKDLRLLSYEVSSYQQDLAEKEAELLSHKIEAEERNDNETTM